MCLNKCCVKNSLGFEKKCIVLTNTFNLVYFYLKLTINVVFNADLDFRNTFLKVRFSNIKKKLFNA